MCIEAKSVFGFHLFSMLKSESNSLVKFFAYLRLYLPRGYYKTIFSLFFQWLNTSEPCLWTVVFLKLTEWFDEGNLLLLRKLREPINIR